MLKPYVEDPLAMQRLIDSLRSDGKSMVDTVLGHREVSFDASAGLNTEGYAWYAPGLAYTFVGLDSSIIKIFAAASGGRGIDVPTAVMPFQVIHGDWPESDVVWYKILQGIPLARADDFEAFTGSFSVENRHAGETTRFSLGEAKAGDVAYKILLPQSDRGAFNLAPDGSVYFGR